MLSLESITAGYTDENIINEVSLRVEEGEIVTIIGPNGCGKSTLMKSIFGLTRMRGGRILFLGQECICSVDRKGEPGDGSHRSCGRN